MLNGELRAFDLSLVGLAAKLPGELGALGEPGGAERMALGDQPAGRIDHRAGAAVGGRLGLDQPVALALSSEPERLVGDQLVRGEAVVELADVDLLGRGARLLVGPPRRLLRHVIADDPDAVGVLVEARRHVGHHRLPGDLDRAVAETVLIHETLGRDDRARRAVRGGRALELGQRLVDHLGRLDVLDRVLVLELRVRVVHGVLVVLPADPGVVIGLRPVLLHVVAAGVAEHLGSGR